MQPKKVYMVFLIDHNGVYATKEQGKALNNAPTPVAVKELRALLAP